MNSAHHLILASNSPRRRELLWQAGFEFQVVTYDFDESFPRDLPPWEVSEFLAKQKNQFYRKKLQNQVVITADTTVVLGDRVYNKPTNATEAKGMIMDFSGKGHEVISGVCISNLEKSVSFSSTTLVTFCEISVAEADYYIQKFKPFDKAGAYGIQEWIGLVKTSKIDGSYFNVVGLPIQRVYDTLVSEFGISPVG